MWVAHEHIRTCKDHEGNDVPGISRESQLQSGGPGDRNEGDAGESKEDAHGGVRYVRRVRLSRRKVVFSVKATQEASQAHQHLRQWGVDVKVKSLIEVVSPKFSKVGFIPYYGVGLADLVEPSGKGDDSV